MRFALKNTPIPVFPSGNGPAITAEQRYAALRIIRNWMLVESDWTQVPDSPLSEEDKTAWRVWRQEMRDITSSISVDTVGDWFEVSDPPTNGLPETWLSWEYDKFNEIMSIYSDLTAQAEAENNAQQEEHIH